MEIGDGEVTDWVSWLDQPSLTDTMASTARIAQGLKEDETVEKTTLSESLNTGSSKFKHLTVKQSFLREPYRLKVHRDAQYLPKPPASDGFSESKPPTSYQMLHRMSLDTEELARRAAIYASLADSMVALVIKEPSPKDQATAREVGYHTGSSSSVSISRFCSSLQSAAVTAGCSAQEIWFPTTSSEHWQDWAFRGVPCPGSGAQGSATTGPDHQAGKSDGRFISNFRSEAQGDQPDQHDEDFLNQEEPAVKDFSVWVLGFYFDYNRSEDHISTSVLLCRCRCETIFWPPNILTPESIYLTIFWPWGEYIVPVRQYFDLPIYWPRGQYYISYDILTLGSIYRNDILTPLTIFWLSLPIVHKTFFCWLWPIVKCGVLLSLHNIYEFWEDRLGMEQVYQNKMRWWLVSCFHLQLVKPFITLWNHVLVVQNESIINTQEIITMNVKKITHLLK